MKYRIGLFAALCTLFTLLNVSSTLAMPRVGEVEAFWEDSLAIVRPEILEPLDTSQRQTLETGVPMRVDVEVRFARTGFVKNSVVGVKVEYDVWTGWYRVTTPLSPLAIKEYSTVERLFEQDLLLLFDESDVDPNREWFVKVRASTELQESGDGEETNHGVSQDLSGFTRFLFQLFGSTADRSSWSELVKLPERGEVSP